MNEKLDVGRVLSRTFEMYRDQFTLLIPAALVLFVPVGLINGFLNSEGGVFLSLVAAALSIVATFWYQGMVVEAARDILDGRRDQTVGSLFSSVSPVLAPLIGAGILAGIGIAIGFVLLIVPGLYLLTIWAVLVPVIVLERTGVFPSFGRSRQLVKGNGWQVFGVLVVLFLLFLVIRVLVAAIIGGIADTFAGFALADLIVNLLTVPISALAASVIYFELKRLHGEPIPGAAPGGALDTAASGVAPEASGGTSTPPAAAPDSGRAAAPQPGSPPPAAPPPGGSRPAGDDPGPQSSRRQAPPNA
ncbi:MAG TPA: hypothetical protein VHJ37_11950 [Thermoleophilaceae bacterium]|jgi:hypothetical protein|nr:hypothetical protein [Thermoleophilaceae bacterium]